MGLYSFFLAEKPEIENPRKASCKPYESGPEPLFKKTHRHAGAPVLSDA
jgi:hypothetical protein